MLVVMEQARNHISYTEVRSWKVVVGTFGTNFQQRKTLLHLLDRAPGVGEFATEGALNKVNAVHLVKGKFGYYICSSRLCSYDNKLRTCKDTLKAL